MLISCKCLNFIATATAAVQAADAPPTTTPNDEGNSIAKALMQVFLHKYPRTFLFYSQCMDFFKQAIGPIPDLTINEINQRYLVYSLTLDVPQCESNEVQSWQLSVCINCNTSLCAKRLHKGKGDNVAAAAAASSPLYLINCSLLTNNDELAHRRADKSYSETFGLLIMDHPQLDTYQNGNNTMFPSALTSNFMNGSMSAITPAETNQQRLRQLLAYQQQRLQREIAETNERIQRYTEQQFALLKSFREKSEQDYQLLVKLIQQVPEQANAEWLDRELPSLDVNGVGLSYATRRRNTISNRRDLNTMSATTGQPVAPIVPSNLTVLPVTNAAWTIGVTSNSLSSAIGTNQQQQQQQLGNTVTPTIITSGITRKLSNFDTPPATPEATPMSVGNSPTFRPQQAGQNFSRLVSTQSFQQQFPTPTAEISDDCLFDLEDVDTSAPPATAVPINYNPRHQNHTHPMQFHRSHSIHNQQRDNMSDLDESDDAAEEAEDALDLETSMPIRMIKAGARTKSSQMLNFAKSLPVAIANSPLAERGYVGESDDELDTVDIAASMKALAKSVHGEAVFGDLPRPRMRSQI